MMEESKLSNCQRPPLIPASKSKARKISYQSPTMVGFERKVAMANKTSICNATQNVGRLTIQQVLELGGYNYAVPIFQRRYCWTVDQWSTLFTDAQKVLQFGKPHSLGRLTCTNNETNTSNKKRARSLILDGQQRFTTVTILLAAIRDAIQNFYKKMSADNDTLVGTINKLLFPDQNELTHYLSDTKSVILSEGIELSSAKLVPTFFDRKPYYMAILPKETIYSHETTHDVMLWSRPLEARRYFDDKLVGMSRDDLNKLASAVLSQMNMLYFPIDIDHERRDGTDDLMVVYDRLALRDATWTKPTRDAEYMSMDGVDMIRNLLLGSFIDEPEAMIFYNLYWLPLEKDAQASVSTMHQTYTTESSSNSKTIQGMFRAFLATKEITHGPNNVGFVGGKLYADFQSYFRTELSSTISVPQGTLEEKVNCIGRNILDFSFDYFQIP